MFEAFFRLRVIPPKEPGGAPAFRILWVNAMDFEMEAAAAVRSAVQGVFTEMLPVYSGAPNAVRYVPLQ